MVRSAMLAAAALLALGPSASAQTTEPSERSQRQEQAAPTPVPRAAAPSDAKPAPSDAKPAASEAERTRSAQSRLAYGLIERLDKDRKPGENIVVSPASLALVLSLIDLGADEKLRAAIHRTLGFDPGSGASAPPAAVGKAGQGPRKGAPKAAAAPEISKDAAAELRRLRDTIMELRGDKSLAEVFSIANMFVFDPASPPLEMAEIGLKAKGAEVRIENLADPKTIARINEWVAEQTKGLIPAILERPPGNSGLVALNALYFKDRWQTPFEANATKPAPFQTAGGSTIEVPMMVLRSGPRLLREEGNFVALDLPYANERFSMAIITTKDKPARAAQFASVVSWLGGDGFEPKLIELSFPRFSLTAREELLPPLDAMGLKDARQSPTALKGFSPVAQRISQITQKTFLKVDEAGTEASAVTAVVTARSAGGPRPEKIVVDKPFMFALRDNKTGLVLMAGYVGSPTAGPVAELKQ